MTETIRLLIDHGVPLIFAAILAGQMGFPLPTPITLLATGALAATGRVNLLVVLIVALIACVIADSSWFCLGRYQSNRVLGLLSRMCPAPVSCVCRTQNVLLRYGLRVIPIAK